MTRRSVWIDRGRPAVGAAALALVVLGGIGSACRNARAANESAPAEPGARASRQTKRFALELDGQIVGLLDGIGGGGVRAEVLDEQTEPDGFLRKRLGQPRPQEITLQVVLAMAPAFYQWIAQTWAAGETGSSVARSGAILELVDDNTVRARREFVGALITEVTVPALDAAEKKPGFLTVRIAPESVRFVRGDGAGSAGGAIRPESRSWLPCHFRVSLDGLDGSRITRVESFTVRTVVRRAAERLVIRTPTLSVTLAEASADPWFDWLEAFTLRGQGEPEQEKNGAILLLSSTHAELARIDLRGVGLCGLTPASAAASEGTGASAGRSSVSADLYVQRIGFRAAGPRPTDAAASDTATPNPRRGLRFQSILK